MGDGLRGILSKLYTGGLWGLLICHAPNAMAGAWTLEPKARQVISTSILDRADRVLGPDIETDGNPNFSKLESGLYIEQGLTQRVTLVGQSAYQTVSFNNGVEQVTFSGFSNSAIGLRYGVIQSDRDAFSVEFHGIVNGGGEDVPDGDLGRGGSSIELRGLYGRNVSVLGKSGFAEIQLAGRTRLNDDPPEIRSDGTLGVQVSEKLLVLVQGFYMQNNGTLSDPMDPVFATRSLKGQASFVYWVKPRLGLQIGAIRTIIGRNVVDEEALLLGLWRKF